MNRSICVPILAAVKAPRTLATMWRRPCLGALLVALLAFPVAAHAEGGPAEPGSIEGVVTKAGGGPVKGAEVCAFDVAEEEEFTECAVTKSSGAYEIIGLDEGPYRVTFESGESGLNLATQYWMLATSPAKATILHVEERKTITGIDAAMVTAPNAAVSGGTEFGDPCEFSYDTYGSAGFELSRATSPLPAAAPVSGVLARWNVNVSPLLFEARLPSVAVRVVEMVGGQTAKIVAKSARGQLQTRENSFETRLPIKAGDYLALGSSESSTPGCISRPHNVEPISSAYFEPPLAQPGSSQGFELGEVGVPVVGVIEPDADEDGYGDETQDGCPQSADFHTACPTVSFAPGYSVGAKTVEVKVRSDATTPVAVTGASPGPGILHAARRLHRGKASPIAVPISASILRRLRHLSPRSALRLRLRAHATDVAGAPSTDHLTVRLPGRG
ncbi:MAG: carboxypeptidase regulatory-like domain-containing protein [Proteobacteria bacterium]|nr:carboxypeptidase regulatory-like domain-containing protein [Pseudomonadota bacterium]